MKNLERITFDPKIMGGGRVPILNELAGLLSGRGNPDALKKCYRAHLEKKYRQEGAGDAPQKKTAA